MRTEEMDVVQEMRVYLPSCTTFNLVFLHSNHLHRHWASGMLSQTRPVVVFARDDRELRDAIARVGAVTNTVPVPETENSLHPWQLPVSGMRRLVERLSRPGDLVV